MTTHEQGGTAPSSPTRPEGGREGIEDLDLGGQRWDGPRRTLLGLGLQAGVRPVLNGWAPLSWRRRWLSLAGRLSQPVPKGVQVEEVELGGRRAWRFTPDDAVDGRTLLYLHGGGYNYGDLGTHGGAVGTLAAALGATTWMPDYRLVPEHPQTAPLEDALAAWRDLAARVDPSDVVVAGDSAGAHLALSLACEVRDAGDLPQPACLCLLSPWVESDPEVARLRPADRIVSRGTLRRDARLWVGELDPADPLLSPINRDLHGLPPTLVQWGRAESLHRDAERLVAALRAADVEVTAEAYEGLWHDAFLQVPTLVEARRWIDRTARWAAGRLGAAPDAH